jgi:hypothetical protein
MVWLHQAMANGAWAGEQKMEVVFNLITREFARKTQPMKALPEPRQRH